MREKEFKAVFDGEKYAMPQDMKYRVKNRISEKSVKTKKPFVKGSVTAMFSIVLASILVITVAAVGGMMLFQSIYGENLEPITPYGEKINLTAADENYELTLHEAVADEFTTAYIFSVKRLTVGVSEAESQDVGKITFKGMWQENRQYGSYGIPHKREFSTRYNEYDTTHIQMFIGGLFGKSLKLLRTDAGFDAENTAQYLIRGIDNLKTEDTDYCALYVINGESQTLSIAIGEDRGPEIALPKMAQKAPSVTRPVQEYYRQYLKQTDPAILFGSGRLAETVTITPLAVYVTSTFDMGGAKSWWAGSIRYINSSLFRNAKLVFSDGSEKTLNEMSQDEMGIMAFDKGVYLFDEVLDTALVKSFLIYDTVEFPMDTNLPVIDRETGTEIVPQYETMDLLYDAGTNLSNYLDSMYTGERKKGQSYGGNLHMEGDSCKIQEIDCTIFLTGYDAMEGEPLTDAASRLLEEYRVKYNRTVFDVAVKDGTCSLGSVRYADVTASVSGGELHHTHYFFFETNGKLVVMQLTQLKESWGYSLDAVLKLITFN